MKDLKIICCGASQQWMGSETLRWPLRPGVRVAEVLDELAKQYPDFAAARAVTAAASGDRLLKGSDAAEPLDELALIPPVSGG